MKKQYRADRKGIADALEMIRSFLERKGIRNKAHSRSMLAAEESLLALIGHSKSEEFTVNVRAFMGTVTAEFSCCGEAYDFNDAQVPEMPELWAAPNSEAEAGLRAAILRGYSDSLKYKHKNGFNIVCLTVHKESRALILTLGALVLAILCAVLLTQLAPASVTGGMDTYFLTPVKTMYLNALKMMAAPVVFFSIANSIAQQSDPSGIGRIGIKIIGIYMCTTVIAVIIGILTFFAIQPGDPQLKDVLLNNSSFQPPEPIKLSLVEMIVNMVPDNLLAPFTGSNMLQIIVLAALIGFAVGKTGEYSSAIRDLFSGCNALFMQLARIIMRVTPLAVFCSILSMLLKTGLNALLSLLGLFGTVLLGLLGMIIVYCLILVLAGLNPFRFLRKYAPTMLQVFSLVSSSGAIPINLEACRKKLFISPKVYSFSIPLGASINMDGTSVLLGVQSLMLARIYGVSVPTSALIGLGFSIILMSIGAPGVPGAGIIIQSMLLTQIGVPTEAVAIVIGTGPLFGMFIAMCNCLGDVIATTVTAKSEKLMDMEAYLKD